MSFDLSIPIGIWVNDKEQAKYWIDHFLKSHKEEGLGLDTETTGLDITRDTVIVWSIADRNNRICLPAEFLHMFKEPILENPEINFDLSNAKYDAHILANSGINIIKAGLWRDTVVQANLINENNLGGHGLKESTRDQFGRSTPTFTEVFGKVPPKRVDKKTGALLSKTVGQIIEEAFKDPAFIEKGSDYASLDAYNSHVLRIRFDQLLSEISTATGSMKDYFYQKEVPFSKTLWAMERRGITVDVGFLKSVQGPVEIKMSSIESDFATEATLLKKQPYMLNLRSVPQVREFFYTLKNKPITSYTDGGTSGNKMPSTDNEVIDLWAGQGDPWAQKFLEYRSIAKSYSTYIVGLQKWVDRNSKIHTTFKQAGARTGRLSSQDPNLQNIPRPGEDEFKLREAFIASEGKVLLVADYEQLEMRLMAHIANDPKMIKAINDGTDIHCFTVSEMEGIPYDEVIAAKKAEKDVKSGKRKNKLTPHEEDLLFKRQTAKSIGFGIIYGIGGGKLAADLTKASGKLYTREDGNMLINKWFSVFPKVHAFIDHTKKDIWTKGYVQTLMGRYRRFGDLNSMSKMERSMAERQGVNSIVQGTASDVAKSAMLLIEKDAELRSYGYDMLLQVHDEIVGEVTDSLETITKAKARVKYLMENALGFQLAVKLPADINHGYSWATAK